MPVVLHLNCNLIYKAKIWGITIAIYLLNTHNKETIKVIAQNKEEYITFTKKNRVDQGIESGKEIFLITIITFILLLHLS